MNYPVWQLEFAGGGLLVALIAIFHVYISHFAVGGGLFLVLTELKAYREQSEEILSYVQRHARFFLLVTMVAGGISGVGIWFIIALTNPAATSMLIHTFVFAWAAEWVFFALEIAALFLYASTFGKIGRRQHLILGWIYFASAWLSLFLINGIIDFMLTPGLWLENQNFWSGFFNPSFWPSLAFRSFFAVLISGLFGLITASWSKNTKLRLTMTRYSALWLLVPFTLFIVSAFWYRTALPTGLDEAIFTKMPSMTIFIKGFLGLSLALIFGSLLLAVRLPQIMSRMAAILMLIAGLLYMGSFEFIREGGRRPYIINDYMYANSILKNDLPKVQSQGLLPSAKWTRYKTVTAENKLEAGRDIYTLSCLSCHAIDGPMHDIQKLTKQYTPFGLNAMISKMHVIHPVMPPFPGTEREQEALAYYIAYGLNGNHDQVEQAPLAMKKVEALHFDHEKDEYILLAWPERGMNTIANTELWTMDSPPNAIRALLILRGETPEIISEDIELSCEITGDLSQDKAKLYPMNKTDNSFIVENIPVLPYTAKGDFDPYPMLTITAKNYEGLTLAKTRVAIPVSTEMGCTTCHGGGKWKAEQGAGMTTATAMNILKTHDRLSHTNLQQMAEKDIQINCRQCHDKEKALNLSASIHGFHGLFFQQMGAEACASCHASAGTTQGFRGIHSIIGLDCTNCHGSMKEHTLSLLQGEVQEGKIQAKILMERIAPDMEVDNEEIQARKPWIQQPDCLNCHVDFEEPETDSTFNQWTADEQELYQQQTDESGSISCAACHAAPHALYPAENDYGAAPHSFQPIQYQNTPLPMGSNKGCAVCHTIEMEDEMHHSNMLREFRN